MSRTGRRKGETRTREAIADAARELFAKRGFDRTSLRAVAAAAGVDPSLVLHFYGSKERLFLSVVSPPVDPAVLIPHVLEGPPEKAGERLALFVLGVIEEPAARERVTAMVRAAASEPAAAAILRDLISREVLTPVAQALGVEDAPLRASLVGSQMVGLVMARYIVQVEPLASASAEQVARAIAPTLTRYLSGPLD